jgi:hypothetical protein
MLTAAGARADGVLGTSALWHGAKHPRQLLEREGLLPDTDGSCEHRTSSGPTQVVELIDRPSSRLLSQAAFGSIECVPLCLTPQH